jgi:hypothetical protein
MVQLDGAYLVNKSFLLALYGSYGYAQMGLRSGAEQILRGAVANHLALNYSTLLKDPSALTTDEFREKSGLEKFTRLARKHAKAFKNLTKQTSPVFGWLATAGTPLEVSPATLFRQLKAWGFLAPIPDAYKYIDYAELSKNVHQSFFSTDLARRWMEYGPIEFPLPVIPSELRDYLLSLRRVADLIGVVSLNSMWPQLRGRQAVLDCLARMSSSRDFARAKLLYTSQLITHLLA